MKKTRWHYAAKVWIYPGDSAWYFVTVPKKESAEITSLFKNQKRGWGSLPVKVVLGKTTWETSIFPDRKMGTYLLPLKKEVRRKEGVMEGDEVVVKIQICV